MLKSRYLLLLSAFFISTLAIPTLARAGKCGENKIWLRFNQGKDDNEFLYENKAAYNSISAQREKIRTTSSGKIYECDFSDYCHNTHIQTMPKNHVFKGKTISEQKTYFCANSEWIAVDLSEKCSKNRYNTQLSVGDSVFRHTTPNKIYVIWQSHNDEDNIQGCIESETNTSTTEKNKTVGQDCTQADLEKQHAKTGQYKKNGDKIECFATKCKNTHYLENDKCTPITPNTTECKNHNIEHASKVVYDSNYQCKIVKTCEQNYIPDQQGTKCINKIGTQCSTADLKDPNAKAGIYKKIDNKIKCFATECPNGAYLVKKDNIEQGYCRTPKCSNDQDPNIIDEKYIDINNQCKNKTTDPTGEEEVEEQEEDAENTILSSVAGKILDNTTNKLISGAQITITGTDISTNSTTEGAFILSNVPKEAQLEISHTGYNTTTIKPTDDGIMVIKLTKAEDDTNNDEESQNVNYDKITGLILEEGKNAPIASVNIKIGNTHTTTTDASGNFTLSNVPSGATLEITHQEYETINNLQAKKNMGQIHLKRKATANEPANNNTTTPENGTDCTDQSLNSKTATYQNGKCVATACNDGYYLTDGNCADINGSPCDNLPANATAGKREYNAATKETTCIVTACDKYYIVSDDKKSCEKDPEQEIQELKDKAQAAKDKEQSTENKLLGAVGIGATGIGGMQLASALAEQSADADALTDMTAYLETFKCTYGNNASVSGGTTNIETPGGNSLLSLYTEYVSLANDLKLRKNMLEMPAGVESEAILSSANGNLYNNGSTDKTSGAYASLARALADPTGADAQKLAQQQTDTADKLKTGAIVAGVGAIGSLAGNLIINKDKYFNKDGEYKSVCDYETDSHTNCITYFNNTPLSKKDKDIMSALSIAYLKKVKGHDATCDKSDIHSTNKRAYIKCASTDGNYDWELKFTINDSLKSADQKKNIFSTVCKIYTGSNASGNTCNANETQCNEITNTMSAMDYTTTYNSDKCELK